MSSKLNKNQIERFSRQIILRNIGALGQKKILNSKVLIIGMGGLGCPVAEFLTRSGVGKLGIVDHDIVSLSNIHRQSLYDGNDLGKSKVKVAQKKLKNINPGTKVNIFNFKLDKKNFEKIVKNYDETNDYALYDGSATFFKLMPGSFAIFYPNDLHMPGVGDFKTNVKKLVMKVSV